MGVPRFQINHTVQVYFPEFIIIYRFFGISLYSLSISNANKLFISNETIIKFKETDSKSRIQVQNFT